MMAAMLSHRLGPIGRTRPRNWAALAAAIGAVAALTFVHQSADACGGFFTPRNRELERRPTLAYEQVLLVYDANAQREHFVREVAFQNADEAFGFVVPTPARPEVEAVVKSPFGSLRTTFPFLERKVDASKTGGGFGAGGSLGSGRAPVEVLETKKVGSFTAFVLRADDATALSGWLAQNGFTSTPEADAWLAHYVKMKFFYVAMRHDVDKNVPKRPVFPATATLASETMRISFASPAPYYPYMEPLRAPGGAKPPQRLLDLWLVTDAPLVPVSLLTAAGRSSWVRPMHEGHRVVGQPFPTSAVDASLAPLFPAGPVVVQRFQDQKISRDGYGDILFVPAAPASRDGGAGSVDVAHFGPLLGVLDPALIGAAR